ncbi:MAG: hypothetical protein FWE53_03890 [Firmicutes bacterium]|nr:hypothetical protein [Bacillota bacterium]
MLTGFKLSRAIDFLFRNAIIFLLIYAWIIFWLQDWIAATAISAVTSVAICFAIDKIKGGKLEKKRLTAKEAEAIEKSALQLMFTPDTETAAYFKLLLSTMHETVLTKNVLSYTNNNNKTVFIPCYRDTALTVQQLAEAVKTAIKNKADNLIIACSTYPPEVEKLAGTIKSIPVTLMNHRQIYQLYIKPSSIELPRIVELKGTARLTVKDLFRYAFSGKRTKSFAFLGLILLISSYFVMFKLYYLITGSLLLVCAIISHINGRRQNSPLR